MKKGGVGGLGGNRIEGLGIMGDVDGPRPKWEVSDSGGPGAGRAYDMVDNRHRSRSQSHNREGGRGAKVVEGVRQKLKHMFRGFHISVSVSFNEKAPEYARYQRTEMTLRIKNNLHGNCVFEVFPSSLSPTIDHGEGGDMDEVLQPVEHLKTLFPHDKNLQRSLQEWNRIFQTPPPHWVVNFVPRAYLRRGYYLAEEVLEYLTTHPDGCQYTVEYEPIGHQPCVVGSVANTVGRNRSMKRGPAGTGGGGDMWWEGKEKEKF